MTNPTPLFAKDRKPALDKRLLEPHELAEQGPPEAVRLPLELVDPNPNNPRRNLVEIEELADNIKRFTTPQQSGLMQPITVRRIAERYELIGGHRRLAAWKLLQEREPFDPQWRSIPAVIRTADDDESYLMLLSSQLHSKAWHPKEEAAGLERLAETRTLKQVGALVNKGESWVSRRLRIYADSVLSGYVQSGKLAPAIAEELLLVPDPAQRREFAEQAIAESWTLTDTRAEVRKLKTDKVIRELGRRVNELLDLLSTIEPTRIPMEAFRDLQVLRGRIEVIANTARGGGPVFPSIEAAQQKARVNPAKPAARRRTKLRVD